MATTVKSGLFVPEVATAIATAEFPNKLAVAFAGSPAVQIIPVDALPNEGDTVKLPRYDALSDFDDMSEDVALTPAALTNSTDTATVVAGGKAVEITDFASLATRGDPSVEVGRQMAVLAARFVDSKLMSAAVTGSTSSSYGTGSITFDRITDSLVTGFGDKAWENPGAIVVHSAVAGQIMKFTEFKSAAVLGSESVITGGLKAIGMIHGYPVYVSNRSTYNGASAGTYNTLVLKRGALGLMFKRELLIEADRNILKKNTIIAGDVRIATKLLYADPANGHRIISGLG